jgi:small conductance mechanosensitive channel
MLRVWVLNGDYWDVNFDTLEQVKLAFDKNNITIPYPQLEMHNIK